MKIIRAKNLEEKDHGDTRTTTILETDKFSIANQRLYRNNKWPIETWAEECFDENTFNELFVKSMEAELGKL